jgi:hypothetical protein
MVWRTFKVIFAFPSSVQVQDTWNQSTVAYFDVISNSLFINNAIINSCIIWAADSEVQ